ncbi:MAG: hypothetical protein HQK79_18070 [Desulfobacterales bacterium]|nr:hypothetical protein [Desulfobacterales bacterium]
MVNEIWKLPGYCFNGGSYEAETLNDAYRVTVKSDEYEGPAILGKKYVPKNFKCNRLAEINGPLVVIGYDDNGLYVAQDNYIELLLKYFYSLSQHRPKRQQFIQWEEDWKISCSKDMIESGRLEYIGIKEKYKNKRWFIIKGLKCHIPVMLHSHLENLYGKSKIFPASLYDYDDFPRCFYKLDGIDLTMPKYFKGELKLSKAGNKVAHIYLHGMTSASKWHYGVLKHIFGISTMSGGIDDKKRWEAFEGKEVSFNEYNMLNECKQNNMATSCNESICLKNLLFRKIHPIIKEYCHRYLLQAVTFFQKNKTNIIKIWQNNRFKNAPKAIDVECIDKIRNTDISILLGGEQIERDETLILRGNCYDWHSSEPTIHLSILTIYSASPRSFPYRDKRDGFNLADTGNINL